MTGNSDTAPGFQKQLGLWMREVASYVDNVPNFVSVPVLALVVAGFAYAVLRKGERGEPEKGQGGAPGHAGADAAGRAR